MSKAKGNEQYTPAELDALEARLKLLNEVREATDHCARCRAIVKGMKPDDPLYKQAVEEWEFAASVLQAYFDELEPKENQHG